MFNLPIKLPGSIGSLFSPAWQTRLLALRRDLHQHPELSFQEKRTAAKLYAELENLQPVHLQRVAETGVIARIRGRHAHTPVVAIRGDLDALPIQEETGLPWASQQAGVMHACGHDVHAAWTIGAAHLLTENPAPGDVLVILQPAEEIGAGAQMILQSGVLEDIRAIFGAHVDRRFPVGEVVAEAGCLAASADTFKLALIGKGGHGARPQECSDPIVGASALIGALQTIVARRLHPAKAAVVSIGTIHAGTASNIIPERAQLTGTLRAIDPQVRRFLQTEVRQISKAMAAAYGLEISIEIEEGTPPLLNSEKLAGCAQQAVRNLLGEMALAPLGASNMTGEDFAFYLEKIPGCFLRIGACEPGGEATPGHSSRFYPAEESIFIGAAVLAETARVASAAMA